jgi:DNA-binding transcriptional LysR family regulator
LGTDHTTVARHVQKLEKRFNRALFFKSHSGYELTDDGTRLLPAAEKIESTYISAAQSFEHEDPMMKTTVRIGTTDGFGSTFLAPRLKKLAEHSPQLQIDLLARAKPFNLAKREADIVVSRAQTGQMRVVSRRLTNYRLRLYSSRSYLQSQAPILRPEQLSQHNFMEYIYDLAYPPEPNFFTRTGIVPKLRSTNLMVLIHATLAGFGICILPNFVTLAFPELVPVLPDEVDQLRSLHIHTREDLRKARHIKTVMDFITEEVHLVRTVFEPGKP